MNRVSAPGAPYIDCLPVLVQTRSITVSKLARSRPPSLSPNSLDHGLQAHLQSRSITASKLARSRPPSVSPNSLDYGLQVHLQTGSITASKLARSWPPSAYPQTRSITAFKCISKLARLQPSSSHDHGLQVDLQPRSITASEFARSWPPSTYLQTRSITASKCISKLARLQPPSSHDHGLQVHLHTRLITASKCISKLARSQPGVYLWVHSIVIFRRTSNCSQAPPAASPDIPCVDW